MSYEDLDTNGNNGENNLEPDMGEGAPQEESSNRPFLVAAGALGAIAILALICIAVYAMLIRPGQLEQRYTQETAQAATSEAIIGETQVAQAVAEASKATATAEAALRATPTLPPVVSVIVIPPGDTAKTYDAPGGNEVGKLESNDRVTVLPETTTEGDTTWVQIQLDGGDRVWVPRDFLNPPPVFVQVQPPSGNSAPVYDQPNGKEIGKLNSGEKVQVLPEAKLEGGNTYVRVVAPGGMMGWMLLDALSPRPDFAVVVSPETGQAPVYVKPGGEKSADFTKNQVVLVLPEVKQFDGKNWVRIVTPDGKSGWVELGSIAMGMSTPTPVVVAQAPTADPRTATVAALLTQAAVTTRTAIPVTTTALPQTGFAEDLQLPLLLGVAVLLVVVIFLARRLRSTN